MASTLLAGCAVPAAVDRATATAPPAGEVKGFLPRESLLDSGALLPPPPAPGSAAEAADEAGYRAIRKLRNTPRWTLATRDAEYRFPKAAGAFSCALGVSIDERATPELYTLLRRTFMDAAFVSTKAKDLYRHRPPFQAGQDPICTPELTEAYRKSQNSYPSNNAAIGWVWALVLSELAPDRIVELMRRGYAYGESRVLCGLHWDSDVAAARVVGAALVAQLHANAEFRAQSDAARRELERVRAVPDRAAPDCALEAAAQGTR